MTGLEILRRLVALDVLNQSQPLVPLHAGQSGKEVRRTLSAMRGERLRRKTAALVNHDRIIDDYPRGVMSRQRFVIRRVVGRLELMRHVFD